MLGAGVLVLGCAPELPAGSTTGSGGQSPAQAPAAFEIRLEPQAELVKAPPILRIHVRPGAPAAATGAAPELATDSVVLVQGEVQSAQLRQLATGEVSKELQKRIVPSLSWLGEDGHLVLAPTIALTLGELYTVASGSLKIAQEITVLQDDPLPTLHRLWPPEGASADATAGVWCGPVFVPELTELVTLDPSGPAGSLVSGALPNGQGSSCVRFVAAPESLSGAAAGPWVAPPVWPHEQASPFARLDPRALVADGPRASAVPLDCSAAEMAFGPGCASVFDDRLLLRCPAEPLLWSIAGEGLDTVFASRPNETVWVYPLPVQSTARLSINTLDTAGSFRTGELVVQTLGPMAHVVINEALANPVGPEPAQEWLELYNDGLAAAELSGYALADPGGQTLLPAAELAPGAYGLLVNETYDPASPFDVPAADGTLLVRVPHLGHDGLSNDGEPLELHDAGGAVVSRFPANPKPKSGRSVMRVTPKAPDAAAESFVRSPGGPTPGSANLSTP